MQWYRATNGRLVSSHFYDPPAGQRSKNSCCAFLAIGLLLASIVANSMQSVRSHKSYQLTIALQFVWAVILAGGMLMLPESPRYLIRKGHDEKAARALARLLTCPVNDPAVVGELDDIRANLKMERELELQAAGGETRWGSGYIACFKKDNHIRFRTLTGIFLQAWQQLTGIKCVFLIALLPVCISC